MLVVKKDILDSYIIPGRLPLTALTSIGRIEKSNLAYTGYPKRWLRFNSQLAALMFLNQFELGRIDAGLPITIRDMLLKTKELIDLFHIKIEADMSSDFNKALSFDEVEKLNK